MKKYIKLVALLLVLTLFVILTIAPRTKTIGPVLQVSTGDPGGGQGSTGIIHLPPGVTAMDVNLEIKPETIDLASNGVYTVFFEFPPADELHIYPQGFEDLPGQKMHMKGEVQDIVLVLTGEEREIYILGSVSNGTDDLYFGGVDTVRVVYEGSY